jgi:hypothetical protein
MCTIRCNNGVVSRKHILAMLIYVLAGSSVSAPYDLHKDLAKGTARLVGHPRQVVLQTRLHGCLD